MIFLLFSEIGQSKYTGVCSGEKPQNVYPICRYNWNKDEVIF